MKYRMMVVLSLLIGATGLTAAERSEANLETVATELQAATDRLAVTFEENNVLMLESADQSSAFIVERVEVGDAVVFDLMLAKGEISTVLYNVEFAAAKNGQRSWTGLSADGQKLGGSLVVASEIDDQDNPAEPDFEQAEFYFAFLDDRGGVIASIQSGSGGATAISAMFGVNFFSDKQEFLWPNPRFLCGCNALNTLCPIDWCTGTSKVCPNVASENCRMMWTWWLV